MATPRIPLELQELVIDLLDDSLTATFLSCALTCRAWLPRSRRRLYHELRLRNIRPMKVNQLVELIERDPEVSNVVRCLFVQERPNSGVQTGEVHEGEVEEAGKENGDDKEEDQEDHWENNDHDEEQPPKVFIRAGTVLLILARKLPYLASLTIWNAVIESSPARPPMLAGFPALTTLELRYVIISSYGAFQRMLAAAPALRILYVCWVTWGPTHIPPTVQHFRLRCPPLTHLAWYTESPLFPEQAERSSLAFSHLVRNLYVCASLEYLCVHDLKSQLVADQIIAGITSTRFRDSLVLRNLSALKLSFHLPRDAARDELSGLLESTTRLIATLWPSGTHAQPRTGRRLRLEFPYSMPSTLMPVTHAGSSHTSLFGTEGVLEHLLQAFKDVSPELEHVMAASDRGSGIVELVFEARANQLQDVFESAEVRRAFIVALRSKVAGIFPELHRRGSLSVEFRTLIIGRSFYNWVEGREGNFEGIPYTPSEF
ncbi:hypothetical protein C8T65DRAFT_740118 [Cerioporus squamosus]|nr:hypothetical protein C8T65DRAFT_740118 [Cerioporus squamosus]